MTTTAVPMIDDDEEDEIHVFEPYSAQVPELRPYLQKVWRRRRVMMAMSRAQLRGGRSNTLVGQAWAVLDPAIQALMYFVLIGILRGGERGSADRLTLLVGGLFLFGYTRAALQGGAGSVAGGSGLMLNTTFPRVLIPLSVVYKGWLELLPALPVYAALHLLTGRPVGQGILVFPLLLAIQTVMNIGLALGMATLGVFIPDISKMLGYAMRILLFMTPVLYPVSWLQQTPAAAVLKFNPLFPLFASYQAIMLGEVPSGGAIAAATVYAVLAFAIGSYFFVTREGRFAILV